MAMTVPMETVAESGRKECSPVTSVLGGLGLTCLSMCYLSVLDYPASEFGMDPVYVVLPRSGSTGTLVGYGRPYLVGIDYLCKN